MDKTHRRFNWRARQTNINKSKQNDNQKVSSKLSEINFKPQFNFDLKIGYYLTGQINELD